MSDTKIQVTDGQNTWLTTPKELLELNRGRPSYLPPVTPVDENAKIRTVSKNHKGETVDELVPAQNAIRRTKLSNENIAADKASIESSRKATEQRDRMAIADEADMTTLLNAALPGAQLMQNAAVGEDAANQARAELNTNIAASLTGNMLEFAIGGKALSLGGKALLGAERAAKVGTALGFGAESSRLARVGRVALENVAVDSHFYVQNSLDSGDEFSAEEYGRQIGMGLLLGSPLLAGAALRGVGGMIRDAVGNGNALGMVGTGLRAAAVLGKPGTIEVAQKVRYAGAASLIQKLFKSPKVRRAMGATDETVLQQAKLLDDFDFVRSATPENAHNPTFWKKFEVVSEGPVQALRDVDWKNTIKQTRTMTREVEGVRRAVRDVFKQLDGSGKHATWTEFTLGKLQRGRVLDAANKAMNFTSDAGMTEIAGTIKRKIIAGGDITTPQMRKALVEAAFAAKLRRGVTGGADQVDDIISEALRDKKIWGASKAKANGKVLDALDTLRGVWDDLGDTHMAKPLRKVDIMDGVNLQKGSGTIDKMRKAVDTLADQGMLSEKQVTAFEARFITAEDAIKSGTEAYADVIKLNKALDDTLGKLTKEVELVGDVPTTAEGFAATKAAAALEVGKDIAGLASKGLDMVLSTAPLAYGSRGVAALHGMSEQEKYEVYEHLERELSTLSGNPEYFMDSLGKHLERGAAWDPAGSDFAGSKTANTVYYLASQMPKRDMTIFGRALPQPMSAVEEFLEKWVAAYDPVSVGYESLRGTVTPAMIDSVRATSPKTYAEMQVTIAEILSKVPAEKANPSALTGASLFLGGLDPMYSGNFIAKLQSSYAQTQTQDEVINGPRQPQPQGHVQNRGTQGNTTTSQRQQSY